MLLHTNYFLRCPPRNSATPLALSPKPMVLASISVLGVPRAIPIAQNAPTLERALHL